MPRVVTGLTATDSDNYYASAAWGGQSPPWWGGALPRCALWRSRGGGKSLEFEWYFTTHGLSAEFGTYAAFTF